MLFQKATVSMSGVWISHWNVFFRPLRLRQRDHFQKRRQRHRKGQELHDTAARKVLNVDTTCFKVSLRQVNTNIYEVENCIKSYLKCHFTEVVLIFLFLSCATCPFQTIRHIHLIIAQTIFRKTFRSMWSLVSLTLRRVSSEVNGTVSTQAGLGYSSLNCQARIFYF